MRSCAAVCGADSWADRRDDTGVRCRVRRAPTPGGEGIKSSRRGFVVCFQMSDQFIDESALTRQYLSPSFRHAEIGDTVDFGKVLCLPRSRRPFHFEMVAGKPA